jgi:hypothetical protein
MDMTYVSVKSKIHNLDLSLKDSTTPARQTVVIFFPGFFAGTINVDKLKNSLRDQSRA